MLNITARQQELIREAMAAANPDEDGSLMRELDKRGVGDIIRAFKYVSIVPSRVVKARDV